jgi:ribokinase
VSSNVSHVYITPGVTTGIAQITVAESGENQIVIVPGANGFLSKEDVEKSREKIISANILVGQLETPFETTLEAFKLNEGVNLIAPL